LLGNIRGARSIFEVRKHPVQRQSHGSPFSIKISAAQSAAAAILLTLAACGGSSSGGPLTLSGTVSGLTTSGLALTSNGVNLEVSSGAKTFTFGPILYDGAVYDVTVPIQPSGQICTVTNATGTATTANISNVVVTCSNRTYTVGGTVSGLTTAGLVLANGSDTQSVAAGATSFTLPTGVAYGSAYKITVTTQPAGLTCSVANASGTVSGTVTNVAVTCTDQPSTVGGSIKGLGSATGLVLVSGTEKYAVPADASSFTFSTPRSPGDAYAVSVESQPGGLTCSPSRNAGTMPAQSVTDVSIVCSSQAYSIGGTITGLTTGGLVLGDGSQSYRVPAGATSFTMPAAVAYGGGYDVSVRAQPAGLTCTIFGGSGAMPASAVMNVDVTCSSGGYTLGGSISGLTTSGLVLSDGAHELAVAARAGRFSMPEALAYGSRYALTVRAQPSDAVCRIAGGTGTMAGDVDTVRIACGPSQAP
jgi:hypothetical protein